MHMLLRTILLTLSGYAILTTIHVFAEETVKLEGTVFESLNPEKALPNVLVRVYRGGQLVMESRTKQDGSYELKYPSGGPITQVRYDLTNYNPSIIEDLSGNKNQNINTILQPAGQKLTVLQGVKVLSALEGIYYVDTLRGVKVRELKENYGGIIAVLKVPNELEEKALYVNALYEFRVPMRKSIPQVPGGEPEKGLYAPR